MASDLARRAREQQSAQKTPQEIMSPVAGAFRAALADRVDVKRFMQAAVSAFQQTPKLRTCSEESILGALFTSAQLGLEVNTPQGLAYLVPYGREATFVMGYRGFVRLFYNAGARSVQWFMVREGDVFRIGSNAQVGMVYEWQQADLDDSRPWIGAVAQVETAAGGIVWDYMSRDQILARRPSNWRGTPWEKWPEPMALKTVLRNLSKRAPMSTDLALAAARDESVVRHVEGVEQPAISHLPVMGERATGVPAAERSRERPQERQERQERPQGRRRPDGPPAPPQDAPPAAEDAPPPEDEESEFERMSEAEYAAWLEQQGPV